jgi:aryl-alcohol dehydrogenase-like predicted oxidoreductase
MKRRILGSTGLEVSPIAIGGAAFTYVHESTGWNPLTDEGAAVVVKTRAWTKASTMSTRRRLTARATAKR